MAHNVIIKWSPKNHETQYEARGKYLQKMAFSDSSGTNKHSDAVSIILILVQDQFSQCLCFSLRAQCHPFKISVHCKACCLSFSILAKPALFTSHLSPKVFFFD